MNLRLLAPLFVFLISSLAIKAQPLKIDIHADAGIMINAETGAIIFQKNIHDLHYPASITKIATGAYALQQKGTTLDQEVIAEQEALVSITSEAKRKGGYTQPSFWLEPGSSHIGIKNGEILSFRDLLYGLMVASGNDAANVIAKYVSGDIPKFVEELNTYVKQAGCQNTHFCNPHGLHHPSHQTTAFDMAQLTRLAMKNPEFRKIVNTVRYKRPKTNKQASTVLVQTNRLLRNGPYYYPKAIGVKTGGTSHALNTFVGAATHEGRTLIVVLLHVKNRTDICQDAINLFEAAFTQPKLKRVLLKQGPQKFALDLPGAKNLVKTYLKEELEMEYYAVEEPHVKAYVQWNKLSPPIGKDQKVGDIHILSDRDETITIAPLFAQENVKGTWWYTVKSFFGDGSPKDLFIKIIIVVVIITLVFFIIRTFKAKK